MVSTFEAQLLVTPAGKPVTVAPVAPVVAYVMLVMAVLIQRNCALVPMAEVSESVAPVYTKSMALPFCCTEKVPTNACAKDAVLMVNLFAAKEAMLVPWAIRHVYELHVLNPVGFPLTNMVVLLAEVALTVIAPLDASKSQLVPAVPLTLLISNRYEDAGLKVNAPVLSVPTVVAALPGATVPLRATVPVVVTLPPSVALAATVTALVEAVLPLTSNVPALSVVTPE